MKSEALFVENCFILKITGKFYLLVALEVKCITALCVTGGQLLF